ncbi:hypothetical protein CAAN1_08S04808 [[Candida] anglica]|uniref:Uncharacterized protein n=1 Tax=[Candida] anglica TaxID=148631 RepID=A0ABP0E5L2_9ASCO
MFGASSSIRVQTFIRVSWGSRRSFQHRKKLIHLLTPTEVILFSRTLCSPLRIARMLIHQPTGNFHSSPIKLNHIRRSTRNWGQRLVFFYIVSNWFILPHQITAFPQEFSEFDSVRSLN